MRYYAQSKPPTDAEVGDVWEETDCMNVSIRIEWSDDEEEDEDE